ncbi:MULTISPECIES: sacsin N-terminal ATP-binding-like domain-containing protein [Flavobacteriaceae]|uniref:Sacsin/Nov domain-containing protein n=2 Tax=Flavobacteriaceae TaxID=49546 RepID=A0A4Y8ATF5_9FLAO|nr:MULTISPECIES: ATP-binding protein [Flavobacteriaceae]TEW75128.1 hypothetical protein E2488_06290 [Gramella jeungdoensis]GGK41336.1 hypothetical protein GCM10007963_06720 [Lutibacter litoralis]
MSNSDKTIRLNKVLRELNISLDKAIEYLATKGFEIEARPTTKISLEEYQILIDGFHIDRSKKAATKEINEVRRKEKEALSLALDEEQEKLRIAEYSKHVVVKAKTERLEIKPVGKINIEPKSSVVESTNSLKQSEQSLDIKKVHLNDFLKDHNVSLKKAVHFLKDLGYEVIIDDDIKISVAELRLLAQEFKNIKSEGESRLKIETEYKKVSRPKATGKTIDLKQFERPKKIISDQENIEGANNFKKRRRIIKKPIKKTVEPELKTSIQIENDLKDYWRMDTFSFMGQFKKSNNGKTCSFIDLRDLNGDLLYFPHIEGTEIEGGISNAFSGRLFNLEEGEYYQFEAEINSNEEFAKKVPLYFRSQSFGKVSHLILERLKKEALVKQIFKDTAPNERVARNQANAIKKVTEDAYEEDERFIFELIQNADDSGSEDNSVDLKFKFKFGHIIVNHNGTPFSKQDVESITSIGYSSPEKSKNIKKTGYKGIGFKAVFIVSDKVAIISGGYTFEFSKDHIFHKKTNWGIENIPWEIQPIWLQKYRIPTQISRNISFHQDSTSFLLELKKNREINPKKVEEDAYKIFQQPRFSLFLRNIAKIELEGGNGKLSIEKRVEKNSHLTDLLINGETDSSWIIWKKSDVFIPEEVKESLQDDNTTPNKLKEANEVSISFAAKVNDNKIIKLKEQESILFTYLPTSVNDYHLPYLVNADFLTILNRQSIKTKKAWNIFLFEQIGYHQFSWAIDIWKEDGPSRFYCLKVIKAPYENMDGPTFDAFNKGFEQAITELCFIPDINNNLCLLSDVIIDESGISILIGDKLFLELYGDEKNLINPNLKSIELLKNLIKVKEVGTVFSLENLVNQIEDLVDWLKLPENNLNFLEFLIKNNELESFKDEAIFLDSYKELRVASEIFFEIPEDEVVLLSLLDIHVLHEKVRNGIENLEKLSLLEYSGPKFLVDYIIPNCSIVDGLIEDKNNSIIFFNYLARYGNKISPENIERLKYFQFYDSHENLVNKIEGEVLYFPNEKLEEFINEKCIPSGQFRLILKEYLVAENSYTLWKSLGVKEYNDSNVSIFFINEIVNKINVINKHLQKLFLINKESAFNATNHILTYFFEHQEHLIQSELAAVKEKLGEMFIITKGNELEAINECFLSQAYTESNDIEKLLKNFPEIEINFLSEKYVEKGNLSKSKWKKTFVDLGCNYDHLNFINESLLYNLKSLDPETIIPATRLLFDYRKQLKDEISDLSKFPVLTKDGIIKIEDAIFSNHYLKFDDVISSLWNICESQNQISVEYSDDKLDDWTIFFISLGLNSFDETGVITHCLEYVIDSQDSPLLSASHYEIISILFQLHQKNSLSAEHYEMLRSIYLMLDSDETTFDIGTNIILSSPYKPKVDFQVLSKSNSIAFLSSKYINIHDKLSDLKVFLFKFGIQDSFKYIKHEVCYRKDLPNWLIEQIDTDFKNIKNNAPGWSRQHKVSPYIEIPYIELILEKELNNLFWSKVFQEDSFRELIFSEMKYSWFGGITKIKGFATTYCSNNEVVLNLEGKLCYPFNLYDNSLTELIKDHSLVSDLKLSDVAIKDGENLSKLIGIKQQLDLFACILILKREENLSFLYKNKVVEILVELLNKVLTDSEETILKEFINTGTILNQVNKWVPIQNLYIPEKGFELSISKSEWLVHASFEPLASYLNVKKLSQEDFIFKSVNTGKGNEFKQRLINRSKYLAFLINQDNYNEKETELINKIQPLTFQQSKKISLEYSNSVVKIEKSNYNFFEQDTNLYYKGAWNEVRAAEMFKWLCAYLNFKNEKLEKAFEDILLAYSEGEIIEYLLEHNFELPEEWLPTKIEDDKSSEGNVENEVVDEIEDNNKSINKDEESEEEDERAKSKEIKDVNIPDEIYETIRTQYSVDEENTLKKLFGDSLSDDDKFNENMVAHIKALHYYESLGYDVSEAESNFKENIEKKFLYPIVKGDINLKVMCRKATSGLLYLGAYAWLNLEEENTIMYILIGNTFQDCKIITTQKELESEEADYWILRRDLEDEISALNNIIESEKDISKLQVLFNLSKSKYSGVFSKWVTTPIDGNIEGNYGNENEI